MRFTVAVGTLRCDVRGQRSALSLPRLGDENVWPILYSIDKTGSHRIGQNVIRFLAQAFFLAKPMFEEIALPFNLQGLRDPFFPFAYDCLNSLFSFWKREQQVHVVWHQHYEMCVPNSLRVSISDGFENAVRDRGTCELILSALFARDCNEIARFTRIDPQRYAMW